MHRAVDAERVRRSASAWPGCGFWDAIGRASAAIGGETFYDRLLEVLSSLVEADLLSLVRYSSFGAPDLVIPREIRTEVAAPYDSGLYAFDPFHHYWRTVGEPAVTSLRRLAPAELWKSRYALEFCAPRASATKSRCSCRRSAEPARPSLSIGPWASSPRPNLPASRVCFRSWPGCTMPISRQSSAVA